MMLVKGYPFEMQGRLAEAIELCEAAVEAARLSGEPALPLLGAVRARLRALLRRRPRRRDRGVRGERAGRRGGWPAARCPRRAAGRGGRSASRCSRRARSSARWEIMRELGGDDLAHKIPVERCFDWEMPGARRAGARASRRPPRPTCARRGARRAARPAPADGARAARARRGPARRGRRRRPRPSSPRRRRTVGRGGRRAAAGRLRARLAGPGARGGGRARAGDRGRCARPSASSTRAARCASATRCAASCASSARARSRAGPRPAGDSGVAALTKRELRDRRARHRPQDEPRDRRAALPQREDGRVAPAQHLRQARRVLPGGRRARGRARPARGDAAGCRTAPRRRDADAARLAELGYRAGARRAGCSIFDNVALGFAAISPVVGLYAVVLVGTVGRRAGVGLGPAGRARGPVPAARGVRRAGVGVPDRRRRLPVEPPADGWRLRLVRRLGGDLRLRGGEHDDRLPRRAVGADPGRDRAHAARDRRHRDGARRSSAPLVGRARASTSSARASGSGSRPRRSRRSGSGSRCCSSSASRTSRCSRDTLGAEALSGGSVAAGMLAALAVGGWVFIGFDACVGGLRGDARRRAARARGRSGSRC